MTKTNFAKLLEISPSRISQLLPQGLPLNEDDTVPVEEALAWLRANASADQGRWLHRSGGRSLAERAEMLLSTTELDPFTRGFYHCAEIMLDPGQHEGLAEDLLASGATMMQAFVGVQAYDAAVRRVVRRFCLDEKRREPTLKQAAVDWKRLAGMVQKRVELRAWNAEMSRCFSAWDATHNSIPSASPKTDDKPTPAKRSKTKTKLRNRPISIEKQKGKP